jgi:hypothetical protein
MQHSGNAAQNCGKPCVLEGLYPKNAALARHSEVLTNVNSKSPGITGSGGAGVGGLGLIGSGGKKGSIANEMLGAHNKPIEMADNRTNLRIIIELTQTFI